MSSATVSPGPAARTNRWWATVRPLVLVTGACAGVFAVLIVVFTDVPLGTAISSYVSGAIGSVDAISETLTRAIPLVLVGVGAAIALRAGVFNVGGEGQMMIGAVAAMVVATWIDGWPAVLVWLIAGVASLVGGAAWVAVPAVLWVRRGVSEILSTLLLNFITVAVLSWLLTSTWLSDPDPYVITAQGAPLPENLRFPVLIDGSRVHLGVFVAVVVIGLTAWMLRTGVGYRIDLVGANASFAERAGIHPTRLRLATLFASAGLAGLAGAVQLFGVSHRLTMGLTGGVGYTGLLVAVLGRGRPVATGVAALVFAALVTGGEALERQGVPRTLSAVIQAIVINGVALAGRNRSTNGAHP